MMMAYDYELQEGGEIAMPSTILQKTKEILKRIGEGMVALLGIAIGLFVLFIVGSIIKWGTVPIQGKGKCWDAIADKQSYLIANAVETDYFLTRWFDDHFVSGVLLQPKDINKAEFTVICHFKGDSYVIDRIEVAEGDKLERMKKLSKLYFNPLK